MKKNKLLIPIMVLILVIGVVGGTLAWLTDKTETKVNTFTVGDINITLDETTSVYKMVPGNTIDKDPSITVKGNSEKCYLFVKVDENGTTYTKDNVTVNKTFKDYITYEVSDGETPKGWIKLTTVHDNVWYRIVNSDSSDQKFNVIGYTNDAGQFVSNKVLVKNTVTKEMLEGAATDAPELSFTAYAVQFDNMADAATAWQEATK